MINLSVNDYLNQLASDVPAPGGGSASALTGALAAALVGMVASLTQDKDKFVAVKADMALLNQNAEDIRQQLAILMEEDTKAFQKAMTAFRLPKETQAERDRRQAQIQTTMIHAAEIPLKTAKIALQVLQLAQIAAEKGNPNAASDAGVATLLAWAAVEGAALNVKTNLGFIKDKSALRNLRMAINDATAAAKVLMEDTMDSVHLALG